MSKVEFSAVLTAVKPRERTDQYRILAAMYCLDAHTTPVTAAAITALLKLHLGTDLPTNLSASLRSYTRYVAPTGVKPLTWRLTAEGVSRLRELSGLPLAEASSSNQYKTDIAFICALEHPEFTAVTRAFGGENAWTEIGDAQRSHVYRQTQLRLGEDELKLVGTTSSSMGLTAAAIATTQLIHVYVPKLVVMLGIAAGTRSGGKAFGDILVADPSVDYNSGKVMRGDDGVRAFQPDPYPIGLNPRLRSLLRKYARPNAVTSAIAQGWAGATPSDQLRVHIGPLGAADQVIDDETRILEIQQNWRKLIGVEMETYGVYRACYEAPDPKPRFVSMKSVCDFAAEKGDSWQEYAAYTSARFAAEFFSREWRNLWGPST